MHEFLYDAVYALANSVRASALELDRDGDGEIDCADHNRLLKLLQRELPEVILTAKEVGALASVFEGSEAGSILIHDLMYSLEQTALQTLITEAPSRQERTYHQYEDAEQRAEAGRDQQHTRVVTAPSNTPASLILCAIQRKLRTRSTSGVSTENRKCLYYLCYCYHSISQTLYAYVSYNITRRIILIYLPPIT